MNDLGILKLWVSLRKHNIKTSACQIALGERYAYEMVIKEIEKMEKRAANKKKDDGRCSNMPEGLL